MLVILSPAKKLVEGAAVPTLPSTQPALGPHIQELMKTTRKLSSADLQSLMHISEKLGDLNEQRFQDFSWPFDTDNARQAALMFAGDTYQGLDAPTLDADTLGWAQDHLAILSGLYGVLRPLDLIQPYRLEMGTPLPTKRGDSLYAFWKKPLTAALGERLSALSEQTLLNCASKEYFGAVDPKALPGRVITPEFREYRDGKPRNISFFAKRARGAMARWVLVNRVDDPARIHDFDADGYRFDPKLTKKDDQPFFSRPDSRT